MVGDASNSHSFVQRAKQGNLQNMGKGQATKQIEDSEVSIE